MIFIDSNIPMYLVGREHPNKQAAQHAVRRLVEDNLRLVTSVEVIQEILHRYSSIGRTDAIDPALDALLGVVDEVWDLQLSDALRAKELVQSAPNASARDAIHVATMERHGAREVLTFDRGFDHWPSVRRLPDDVVSGAVESG